MNTILHMKRPRSRGHVTCDMCGNTVPRGVRYKRIEMPDMGTIVTTIVCDECDECANLCMSESDMWDDGVTADDIQEWALQSSHPAAVRYLDRYKQAERLGAAS
jgi:hypothetical protein